MPNQWQPRYVPLAAGLRTKDDPRALQPPQLAICRNAEFDELGGIQKRRPFASIGTSILGGGTIADLRRATTNGDERLLFTKDTLYSWSARDAKWVSKGTHLAVKTRERTVYANTAEQYVADRAELGTCVVYAWTEQLSGVTHTYVAAIDKTTGTQLLAPTDIGVDTSRPRLVALTNKIILTYVFSNALLAKAIDPADLATSAGAAGTDVTTADASFQDVYDIIPTSSSQVCAVYWRSGGTSYGLTKFGENLSETQTTKARTTTASTPLAIALDPTGTTLFVFRYNGTTLKADGITLSSFVDATVDTTVATGVTGTRNQLTAAFRTVQDGGQYRCYVFYVNGETSASDNNFTSKINYIDTAYAVGTATTFLSWGSLASRAFARDGRVYVWTIFASESTTMTESSAVRAQLQNTYFLHRDDVFLVAKAAAARAGGFTQAQAWLPGVQSLGGDEYAFMGIERRIIPTGGGKRARYAARSPREIVATFDSDEARRTARLGRTLYVTGGQLLQYDGEGLVEVGFHVYPWSFDAIDGGAGSKIAGTFTYKSTERWDNARGERDRSTTASSDTITLAASHLAAISLAHNDFTRKQGTRRPVIHEVWATLKDPVLDAPMYLVSSNDPTATSNPNKYVPNVIGGAFLTFQDSYSDATAATKEAHDESGSVIERLAPPACTIICATQDRLVLAGIADNPYQVWYSRLRGDAEVASFHDDLTFEVPASGGAITALAFLNETLVVFCKTSIWMLPGDGFGNVGDADGSRNYGPARVLASDLGALSAEAVALSPRGLEFKSSKGWRLIDRGWQIQNTGNPIADFDGDGVSAIHVLEGKQQIRIVGTTARVLVYDLDAGQWSEWTIADGIGAVIWGGVYHYLTSSAPKAEQADYSTADYSLDIETAWIPVGEHPTAEGAVRYVMPLGEYRSTHDLRVRLARDHLYDGAGSPVYFDSKYWAATPAVVGSALELRHGPSIHKMQAIKVRLTDYAHGSTTTPPAGEALKLTGLALEVAVQPGLRRLPAVQKQ